jgi:hypothetical protein
MSPRLRKEALALPKVTPKFLAVAALGQWVVHSYIMLCFIVLYILYSTLYCIVLHCVALHCMVLYCIAVFLTTPLIDQICACKHGMKQKTHTHTHACTYKHTHTLTQSLSHTTCHLQASPCLRWGCSSPRFRTLCFTSPASWMLQRAASSSC